MKPAHFFGDHAGRIRVRVGAGPGPESYAAEAHSAEVSSDATQETTLLIAGDWASTRCYADAAKRSPAELYGELAPFIESASLSIVNLECSLAGDTPIEKEGPNLRGTPDSAAALAAAGFSVAALGNNHSADFGDEALARTREICEKAGLLTVGAGADRNEAATAVVTELDGVKIGILNIADAEDAVADAWSGGVASAEDHRVLEWLQAARAACDVLLVIAHGGREYVPVPSYPWYDRLVSIAARGADLVVAHHPHVPQGVGFVTPPDRSPIPIIFSTGNFVFRPAMPAAKQIPPHTADGYMVRARITRRSKQLAGLELIPYAIEGDRGLRGITGAECEGYATFLSELSADLHSPQRVRDWFDAVVDFQWENHYRDRFATFTRRALEGDPSALPFVRSHHRSTVHRSLIDRALQRIQAGTAGTAPADIREKLHRWYDGSWPSDRFGTPIADPAPGS
jgi:poly-gamma-glutamate synthesis protein (capsule biosynthesis protein)